MGARERFMKKKFYPTITFNLNKGKKHNPIFTKKKKIRKKKNK